MYGQGKHAWSGQFHYYKFIISMSNFDGSCNTAEDPGSRICVPNKMEDVNFKVFTMIEGINKPKILAQHISHGIINVNLMIGNITRGDIVSVSLKAIKTSRRC